MLELHNDDDDADDTHLCIKCKATIIGLDNYVKHRKTVCGKAVTNELDKKKLGEEINSYLGADLFFSKLELQSSAKKPTTPNSKNRVLTRKATAAILANQSAPTATTTRDVFKKPSGASDLIGGKLPVTDDNQTMLIQWTKDNISTKKEDNFKLNYNLLDNYTSESSEDDLDDYRNPPRNHTGGKWKPRSPWPPTTDRMLDWYDEEHTGGKWKPTQDAPDEYSKRADDKLHKSEHFFDVITSKLTKDDHYFDDDQPPPDHTKGKWIPGQNSQESIAPTSVKIPQKTIKQMPTEHWCGPCNRRLSSQLLYDRHLTSNLHLKRTMYERELEFDPRGSKRNIKPSIYLNESIYPKIQRRNRKMESKVKKRNRRPMYMKCIVCKSKILPHLMGKHLISHYHFRKADLENQESRNMILDNIHSIVKQSPFQCQICKFYTNSEELFLVHWNSVNHFENASQNNGIFWCSFCKFETTQLLGMTEHLTSLNHQEVISVINRSVPIIIRKKRLLGCGICKRNFRYNLQLKKHGETNCHPEENTSSFSYQHKFSCSQCKMIFNSQITLQRHKAKMHSEQTYFCSACKLMFPSSSEAKEHRKSTLHKVATTKVRQTKGLAVKDLTKKCLHCTEIMDNVLELKKHIEDKHPDQKHSCHQCGMEFLLPQEVSMHKRKNQCQYQNRNKSWKCKICPFSTESQAEYMFHEVLHKNKDLHNEKTGKFSCPVCFKVFNKASLRCHLRQHTNERPFQCSQCPRAFARKSNLVDHIDKVHVKKKLPQSVTKVSKERTISESEERLHVCSVCQAAFAKKYTLQQHLYTHRELGVSSMAMFFCDEPGCSYVARSNAQLTTHAATHGNDRPHACTNCDYSAKTRNQLLRHMTLHSQNKVRYNCTQCSYSGRLRCLLTRHMQSHSTPNVMKYRCPHCEFKCQTVENLRKHVLNTSKHPGKELYICDVCPLRQKYSTNMAKDFRRHLTQVHSTRFITDKDAVKYVSEFLMDSRNQTRAYSIPDDFQTNNTPTSQPFTLSSLLLSSEPERIEHLPVLAPKQEVSSEPFSDHHEFRLNDNLELEVIYSVDAKGMLIPFNN